MHAFSFCHFFCAPKEMVKERQLRDPKSSLRLILRRGSSHAMRLHSSILCFCIAYTSFAWHAEAATPVINEVMWPGSDSSSSDEWFELHLPPCTTEDTSCDPVSLGSFTVTYLKGTGEEATMLTFASDLTILPGQYLVVSRFTASNSRLLSEPAVVTSALTLANTGLRLQLKDASGTILDEVDDGSGTPFAGANPSSPGTKASMERIDATVAGTIKENWRTSTVSRGFDDGVSIFGTPGFENSPDESASSASSVSSSSSSVSSSTCSSDLVPTISLQSGEYSGIGRLTLNVQAIASQGSLANATCHFDFGDGYTSNSCNPPAHSYDRSGSFSLILTVTNQCGTTLTQTQAIQVQPDPTSSSAGQSLVYEKSQILISGVLPNPDGKDVDVEWIELTNREDRVVPLAGWYLDVGIKKIKHYAIESIPSLAAHETVRLYQLESGIELSNAADTVNLVDPQGSIISSVHWKNAQEGRVYRSDSFKNGSLKGSVTRVIDATTLLVSFDAASAQLIGSENEQVHLQGIQKIQGDSLEFLAIQNQGIEMMRALVENKRVELLFDTEVWNEDGLLAAYIHGEAGGILQRELLLSGFAIADTTEDYNSRKDYEEFQQKAKDDYVGLWSSAELIESILLQGAQAKAKKVLLQSSSDTFLGSSGKILITEVFAAPDSSKAKANNGSVLSREWIELYNAEDEQVFLAGWQLIVGKKILKFGPSSVIESKKHRIVFADTVGLNLKNDGENIELISPDGTYRISFSYPKMKLGFSYTFDEVKESYCTSKSPSPGESGTCTEVIEKAQNTSNKKKATTKVAAKRPSVYEKYAVSYNQNLEQAGGNIVLVDPRQESTSPLLYVAGGVGMGAAGVFLGFKRKLQK